MATDVNTTSDDRIDGYRYVRTMHHGHSAHVMEVVQESTQRRFALKRLLASRSDERDEYRSFIREAQLGMELRHPNLIRVYEVVKDRSQPYFVMEMFGGHHLKLSIAKPQQYPILPGQLHRIITQAAGALAYMHGKGWVHRDVKPENILVNGACEVRVIDYALARKVAGGLSRLFGGKVPREGTRTYIAPEQIRCEPPAVSADIYSLGITCYELACGRPPFRANSSQELLQKHLGERPIPLTSHDKRITPEFNDLVLRMIQKQPADRLESLDEFLSRFRSARIYADDPDPAAARDAGFA